MTAYRVGFNAGAAASAPFVRQLERAGLQSVRLDGDRMTFVVQCEDASLAPYAGVGALARAGIGWAGVSLEGDAR